MTKEIPNRIEYKDTTIGRVPKEWEVTNLGEGIELLSGQHILAEHCNDNGRGLPYLTGPADFSDGVISSTKFTEKPAVVCTPGDILVTVKGSGTGKIVKADKSYCISRQLMAVQAKLWNQEYLFQFLKYREKRFEAFASGLIPGITRNDILFEPIPVPSLPEQEAIAHVLSTRDTAISKNNQLIVKKELQKKWLMQNLLTGKKRLRGFVAEWKECHLSEMFTERNETGYSNLPLLSVGAAGIYPQSDSTKKDTSNEDKSKYKRIYPGDIGYNTMRMWQGRCALSALNGIVSPAYTIVTPMESADPLFFFYLFKTPKLMNLFWRKSQGLVDDTLNCKFKDFRIVKIIAPATKEQTAIAKLLQSADKEIQLLKSKVAKIQDQKKWMMQVLLTGRKRLNCE